MKIYFNDLSLEAGLLEPDFRTSISQVIELIKVLEEELKENLYVDTHNVIKWKSKQEKEGYLIGEALDEFTLFLKKLSAGNKIIQVDGNTYFELYYIESNLEKNSFIGDFFFVQVWADKIQQEEILIINIPDDEYSKRHFIPIFLNEPKGYEYQNFPCLNTDKLDQIKIYIYANTLIKSLLEDNRKDKVEELIDLWNQSLQKQKTQVWNLVFDQENKIETLFPLGEVSDWVVENTKNKSDIAQKMKLAEVIAFINGWEKNFDLTRINNRDVYQPKNNFQGSILYLATDTQHGEFEVHDTSSMNNHLGAISFDRKKFKGKKDNRTLNLK